MIHPKLAEISSCLYRVSAKALIVRGRKLLLTTEGDEQPDLNLRGIPGGGVDYGEDLVEALQRELREELGLDITAAQISATPVRLGFGILSDLEWSGDRNVPTLNAYFAVKLDDKQAPAANENDFIWADETAVKTANFVTQTAPERQFFLDYLKEAV